MLSSDKMKVIREQAYGCYASELPGICKVYPITVGTVLEMGSDEYSKRLNILLLNSTDVEKILKEKGVEVKEGESPSPLAFLLQNAAVDDNFFLELKAAFSTFIKEDILLLPTLNAVLIGSKVEKKLITEDNFSDFQTILRIQNRKSVPKPPPENESALAKKMRLAKEKRDYYKRKQQQKNGAAMDLADLLEIAEVFGIDYKNKSIYAFYGLIQRHQLRERYEQDIRMLCAGADPQKIKAKYWGSNPED